MLRIAIRPSVIDTRVGARNDRRMKRAIAAVATAFFVTALVVAQNAISSQLEALVDTERAFAQAATDKGIRDSFLEYFADDAMAFNPAPISAKERLRSRPARPFSEYELRWEPRTGDIAASGELGWLTGPSTFIDHTKPNATPQHGNYLSVWRRQADGRWRVYIDSGSEPPQPVSFQAGFTRFPFPSKFAGSQPPATSAAALLAADKMLNAQIAMAGSAEAYATATTAATRLHRSGFMPTIGAAAIRSWMKEHAPGMTASTGAADTARSGDLGYSYGTYDVKGAQPQHGAYVRVWQRDAAGKWLLVADVVQKF
jgi:ketosteroid isomerase-like protein